MSGTLIIGASQAGLQVATTLRELGDGSPITLIGSETHLPYQRPPLSKAYLAGKVGPEGLSFRGAEWYRENAIDLVLGEKVTGARLPAEDRPGVAVTSTGQRLEFDRLALTVGGRARRIRVPGHDLDGVCYLRHLDDAGELRRRLGSAQDVVVIGGGFIGLEAAAAARAAGKRVTVVDIADRLLARAVAPVVSDFYLDAHRRRGTHVMLGAGVEEILGSCGRVAGVRLASGQYLPADLVLVGVGLQPRTELAEQLGLAVDGGIVVGTDARTSHPAVVAAGDCTVTTHPARGSLRLESVQNAVAQAKVAAATLVGVAPPDTGIPWFWSDQADLKLQVAGLNSGYDQVVVRGEPSSESFSALYYRAGQLISTDSVNAPRDYMAVRKILERGGNVSPAAAADRDVALKAHLKAIA
ncbi:FAD-dependent oxidoreductase [Nocardioides sp. NPDC047086]|uniref:NAD(P)/FAD-dependent oxidoreductase n=1 Tax=Nocardioides sp. NPDC047086 TaxID=3154810 RepID=UPI0033ED0C67